MDSKEQFSNYIKTVINPERIKNDLAEMTDEEIDLCYSILEQFHKLNENVGPIKTERLKKH